MAQYERAKEIERRFLRTVRDLEKKRISVYVKLSRDGKVTGITVNPQEAAKRGYTKIN